MQVFHIYYVEELTCSFNKELGAYNVLSTRETEAYTTKSLP